MSNYCRYFWQHKLRFVDGKLQERVEVNGTDHDGENYSPSLEWKDVPQTNKTDDGFREE